MQNRVKINRDREHVRLRATLFNEQDSKIKIIQEIGEANLKKRMMYRGKQERENMQKQKIYDAEKYIEERGKKIIIKEKYRGCSEENKEKYRM